MPDISVSFALAAFIAGFLMFLAPCTLPLVPAYLAFVSGVAPGKENEKLSHRKMITRGLLFVFGFSLVFIIFGTLAGFFGVFTGTLRHVLIPVTGVIIIFFGLVMLRVIHLPVLDATHQVGWLRHVSPTGPFSSFVIGAAFALGWTPCVGPILGSVLLLAGTADTVLSGTLLLAIFSLGLAIPFVLTAVLYAQATQFLHKTERFLSISQYVGGVFLLVIGVLLLTDNFALTVTYGYRLTEWLGLGNLLDYY